MFKLKSSIPILKKELIDGLRDKRSLMTIFFAPILILFTIYAGSHYLVYLQKETQGFTLSVSGLDRASPLMDWFEEEGLTLKAAPENPYQAVKDQNVDFVLVIPEGFPEDFENFETAKVILIYDRSRNNLQGKIYSIKSLVRQWSNKITTLRLINRGVSPQLLSPIEIQDVDVAEESNAASALYGMLALILTITVFTSSTGLSIDMMAGEREKHSLEPLLLSPVPRWSILIGKWGAGILCTLFVLLFVNLSVYFLIPILPLDELGVRSKITFSEIFLVSLVAIPLIFLATIFQLFVAIFSKSFKEAQSYIALLIMVPMASGYYVIFTDLSQPWQYWVPIMSSQTLTEDILSGNSVGLMAYVASVGVALAISIVLAGVTIKQLNREKIIYG